MARRLDSFLTKFGAASDLIVVLQGAPRAEITSFATELAAELRAEPAIGQVTERLDPRFFLEHAYLLMPAERLDRLGSMMTAPGRPLGLDESLQEAMAWLEDGPSGIDLDTAGDIAETLSALLEEWQLWLSAEEAPNGPGVGNGPAGRAECHNKTLPANPRIGCFNPYPSRRSTRR